MLATVSTHVTSPIELLYMVSVCVGGVRLHRVSLSGFLSHKELVYCEAVPHSVFCVCHLSLLCDPNTDKQTWSTTAVPPTVLGWQWGGGIVVGRFTIFILITALHTGINRTITVFEWQFLTKLYSVDENHYGNVPTSLRNHLIDWSVRYTVGTRIARDCM